MTEPRNAFEFLDDYRKNSETKTSEYHKMKMYLGVKAREKGVPVCGQFELTPMCNFDCKMCYVHLDSNQLEGRDVLTVETWKKLMQAAWQAGMMYVTLTGGECLAYHGFEELFLFLHDLGCEVTVLTNGFLLDEKRIQFFKEHSPSLIQITLYGWNDDVYERVTGKRAFSAVSKNIRHAIEEDLPVAITITPNRYLGEDVFETIHTAKELCSRVMINSSISIPREETGRSEQRDDIEQDLYVRAYRYCDQLAGFDEHKIKEEDLPPYGGSSHESTRRGLRCGGGRSSFAIDWKGTLMPCLDMPMICAYPLKEGFKTAWAKVNQEANNWPRVPECEGCAYIDACNNCAAYMLRFATPGDMPIDLCERTKNLVRNGIRHIPECE